MKLSAVTVCFTCLQSSQNLSIQFYTEFSLDLDRVSLPENTDNSWRHTRNANDLKGTWEQNEIQV